MKYVNRHACRPTSSVVTPSSSSASAPPRSRCSRSTTPTCRPTSLPSGFRRVSFATAFCTPPTRAAAWRAHRDLPCGHAPHHAIHCQHVPHTPVRSPSERFQLCAERPLEAGGMRVGPWGSPIILHNSHTHIRVLIAHPISTHIAHPISTHSTHRTATGQKASGSGFRLY